MLRCLAFFQALYDCRLRAVHISGVQNTGADDLSWGKAAAFRARFTQSSSYPSQVLQGLINLLCTCPPDWTSLYWRDLQGFSDEGLSDSSHRVYSAGWRKYLSFVEAFSLEAYPIDKEKVTLFVAFLGVQRILPISPSPFSSTC